MGNKIEKELILTFEHWWDALVAHPWIFASVVAVIIVVLLLSVFVFLFFSKKTGLLDKISVIVKGSAPEDIKNILDKLDNLEKQIGEVKGEHSKLLSESILKLVQDMLEHEKNTILEVFKKSIVTGENISAKLKSEGIELNTYPQYVVSHILKLWADGFFSSIHMPNWYDQIDSQVKLLMQPLDTFKKGMHYDTIEDIRNSLSALLNSVKSDWSELAGEVREKETMIKSKLGGKNVQG